MAEKIGCAGKSNKAHPDAITAALHQAGHQVKYQEFPGMCHTYNVPSPSSGKAFGFYLQSGKLTILRNIFLPDFLFYRAIKTCFSAFGSYVISRMASTVAGRFFMSCKTTTAAWKWHYFSAPDIPEDVFLPENNILALPDGRTITGVPFDFPESGIVDMYDIISPRPAGWEKTVLTAEFTAEDSGRMFAGVAADWAWLLRVNGEIIRDARTTGNSEIPVRTDNHFADFPYRKGKNIVTLEVRGGNTMCVAFKLMERKPEPDFIYPPFVSYPDSASSGMSVIFKANRICPAAVDFRKVNESSWQRVYDNLGGQIRRDRDVHHIRLVGLEPDCRYEYRAVLFDDDLEFKEYDGKIYSFRTAPAKGEFTFLATADLQSESDRVPYLKTFFAEHGKNVDFFAFLGDLLWATDFNYSFMERFILPLREITGNTMPLLMVRGNHEIYGKDSNRFFDYFTPPVRGREGYFMFRYGEVCFIVLDFCDDAPRMAPPSTRQWHDFEPYIAAEAKWLKEAVKHPDCQTAKYRIVLAHGVPLGDVQQYMPGHVRQVIDPVFGGKDPAVKIHLWLGGHIHRPFRSVPGENACYSALPPAEFSEPHPKLGENYTFPVIITGGPNGKLGGNMQFTGMKIHVTPEKITVCSFDREQTEFDRVEISPSGEILHEISSMPKYNY